MQYRKNISGVSDVLPFILIPQGVMEATEFLLKSGHVPKRTFYIAFGHDEEVSRITITFSTLKYCYLSIE